MTLNELSEHYKLRAQLAEVESMLQSLRCAASPGAQALTGMPHATGVRDKVGDLAVEIATMADEADRLRQEIGQQEEAVQAYIAAIPDPRTRTIFRLRFIRGLMWCEVAAILGGGNSASGVKMACYRYAESCDSM